MKINSNYELKDTSSLYIKNLAIMTSPVSKWSWILKSRFLHYGHNPVFEARRMMNDHWAAALQSLKAEAEYGADQLFLIDLLSIVASTSSNH